MNSPSQRRGRGTASVAAFFILVAMVVFAPLIRGGNRPLPLLVLEVMALAGLFIALVPANMRRRIPPGAAIVAGLAATIPLLGLLPLPDALWSSLPGRGQFAGTLSAGRDASTWRALSLAPFETEYSGLALLPPLAAFLLVSGMRANRLRALCMVIVAVAVLEAVLGLLQYGAGGGQIADFRASGTYVNPNHFAGLMLLALPLALMFLALEVGERAHGRRFALTFADVVRQFVGSKGAHVLVGLAAVVLCLLGLLFSRSRAGLTIGALGIVLTSLIASPRIGGSRAYGAVGVGLTLAAGFAIAIGVVPVLDRFSLADTIDNGRAGIVLGALDMAAHYFPFGAGMGTFATLYPPYQPADISALVHRAHNDYVEWLTEGGVLAALAIGAALALYVARVLKLVRTKQRDATHYIQLAAAVSVLLLAVHGMVDFNFRIPANAMLFAVLAGVLVARHADPSVEPFVTRRAAPNSRAAARMPPPPPPAVATTREDAERVRAAWTTPPPKTADPVHPNATPRPEESARGPSAADPTKA